MPSVNLRQVPLLRGLPAHELRRVLAIAQTYSFPAGSSIFDKDDIARHMFIVLEGRIKIYSRLGSRKRKIFAYLGPGDLFGEMAMLEGNTRTASAEVTERAKLLTIHQRDFKKLLLSDARLAYNLLKTLSARLRHADEEIEGLLFKNMLGRLAKTLCELGRRFGRKSARGILLKQRFTQSDLADLVGTTREPLARALARLRRAELVDTDGECLFIRDPKGLEAVARSD